MLWILKKQAGKTVGFPNKNSKVALIQSERV